MPQLFPRLTQLDMLHGAIWILRIIQTARHYYFSMAKVTLTAELLASFFDHNILPRYNAPAPLNGIYGWMREGTEISLGSAVEIEENVGLYGGPYTPFRGGFSSHGFATVGAFSSCASPLPERIVLGRYCEISTGLRIIDSAHPLDTLTTSASMFRPNNHLYQPIMTPDVREHARNFKHVPESYPTLGNDVWVGANVTLSPKISIGTGAVVAAGSMVTRDVPPYAVVGGNPARVLKYRFPAETVERLLESRWWDYEPAQVFSSDPKGINEILGRVETRELDLYTPRKIVLGASK